MNNGKMSHIIHTMHCKATMVVTWSFHFKDSGKEKRKKKVEKETHVHVLRRLYWQDSAKVLFHTIFKFI